MGLLDHRRTWRYVVRAAPNQCIDAFFAAFSSSGGLIMKAEWKLSRTRGGATAVYKGRRGIGAMAGMLSKTTAIEQESAIGSTVTFEIEESRGGQVGCAMWLSSSGRAGVAGLLGFTSDARFIRPYMRAVEDRLRQIDPDLQIGKGLASAAVNIPEVTAEQEEKRKAEWAEAIAVKVGEMWTCPVCNYSKNPGGRFRCAQCRTEMGRP